MAVVRWNIRLPLLTALVAGAVASVFAEIPASKELPPELGEWNSNFAEAKLLAEQFSIPMVAFWGGASCDNCRTVEAWLQTDEVVTWRKERKLVMVYQKGTDGEMHKFVQNPSGAFPYICVYWLKDDGTATTNRFSGTTRGTSRWPVTGRNIAEHFILSVESFISDYQPSENYGGQFAVGNAEGNRLEAVPGRTARVSVPLTRVRASVPFESSNWLVVAYPEGAVEAAPVTNLVTWASGQESAAVDVEIPAGAWRAGDEIGLYLFDRESKPVARSGITMVKDPGNVLSNPAWIGEDFGFGEWTMDLERATNETAHADGAAYTLVYFTGVLWCPWCKGLEAGVISKPEFAAWAKDNQVNLVAMDNPHRSPDPNPTVPNGTPPTLLRYAAAANGVSGAAYLSRKTIGTEEAEAVLQRNHTMGYPGGLFCAPESARTGYPTFILQRKDGAIVGRFAPWRTDDKVYDTAENMARLDDLLKLASRSDESSDYRTTTELRHAVGSDGSTTLQVNRRTEFLKLDGVIAGRLNVQRTDNGATPVVFSLLQGDRALATATNALTALVSADAARGGGFFLKVSAYADCTSVKYCCPDGGTPVTTVFTADWTTSSILLPEDSRIEFTPSATRLQMETVAGQDYKLSGFSTESLAEAFDFDEVRGLYVGKTDGLVDLDVAAKGEPVAYQTWNPGEVAFATGSFSLAETSGVTEVEVVRTNGYSGAATVAVHADLSRISAGRCRVGVVNDGVFVACEPVFVWAEGETGAKAFAIAVTDDIIHDGDQTAYFALEVLEGETEVSGDAGTIGVTILEDDDDVPGRLAVTATDPAIARNATVYATTGSVVSVEVSRLVGSSGDASVAFRATVGGEDRTDELMEVSELFWADGRTRQSPDVQTVTLLVPEDLGTRKLVLSLKATGAALERTSKELTVLAIDATAPRFKDGASVSLGLMRYVTVSKELELERLSDGDAVTVRKLSGSLPSGLKASYSAKNRTLVLTGAPTRTGTGTAVYQVTQVRDGVAFTGPATEVSVTVSDTTEAYPALVRSRTFRDIPLVDADSGRLAGVLTLTVPTKGTASAKYVCSAGTLSFTAPGWAGELDGELMALLQGARREAAGYWIQLFQRKDGSLLVSVYDTDYPTVTLDATVGTGAPWGSANRADAWKGLYTVALPAKDYKALSNDPSAFAVAASGTPTMTLKMTTSSARSAGRMTVAGVLANGQTFSGSSVLTRGTGGETALLPVVKRTSRDFFTALLEIKADAEASYLERHDHRAISAPAGVTPWWKHTEKSELGIFGWTYDVHGAYFDPAEDLGACMKETGVESDAFFTVASDMVMDSPYRGVAGEVGQQAVTVNPRPVCAKVRLSYVPSTGVVRGSFLFPFSEKDVTATWRGVVLPGYTGCGCVEGEPDPLPFIMGACWFKDVFYYTEPDALDPTPLKLKINRGCAVTAETRTEANGPQ